MDCLQEKLDSLFEECNTVNSLRNKVRFIRENLREMKFDSWVYRLFVNELERSIKILRKNALLFECNREFVS